MPLRARASTNAASSSPEARCQDYLASQISQSSGTDASSDLGQPRPTRSSMRGAGRRVLPPQLGSEQVIGDRFARPALIKDPELITQEQPLFSLVTFWR